MSVRARNTRHARNLRMHGVLRGTAVALVAVLTFGASTAYAMYRHYSGNVHTVDISALVGGDPSSGTKPATLKDPDAGKSVNILVLGSDSRSGANGSLGGKVATGMRSDTAIVVHISSDRSRVEAVSIPRDSIVDIPSCTASNGKKSSPQHNAMFNAAFATGNDMGGDIGSAAACTWKTVEANTGVKLNDYLVVDFEGFEQMVNAIGGVPICVPYDMKDKKANHLDLKAGYQTLNGIQALGFARSRHAVGNGSDIGRIGNQQRLIAAMIQHLLTKDVLTSPKSVLGFLDAATKSLTTNMSLTDMTGLAYNMRSIRGANITFMTVPWEPWPQDKNRVVWKSSAATIWANMAADRPALGEATTQPATSSTAAPTSGSAPTATSTPTTAPTSGSTAPKTPKPAATKKAGEEAFSVDDTTAVCTAS